MTTTTPQPALHLTHPITSISKQSNPVYYDCPNYETIRTVRYINKVKISEILGEIKEFPLQPISPFDADCSGLNSHKETIMCGDSDNLTYKNLKKNLYKHKKSKYLLHAQPSINNENKYKLGFETKFDPKQNIIATKYVVPINGTTFKAKLVTYPREINYDNSEFKYKFSHLGFIQIKINDIFWDIAIYKQIKKLPKLSCCLNIFNCCSNYNPRLTQLFRPVLEHTIILHKHYFAIIQPGNTTSVNIFDNKYYELLHKYKSSLAQGLATDMSYEGDNFIKNIYYHAGVLVHANLITYDTRLYYQLNHCNKPTKPPTFKPAKQHFSTTFYIPTQEISLTIGMFDGSYIIINEDGRDLTLNEMLYNLAQERKAPKAPEFIEFTKFKSNTESTPLIDLNKFTKSKFVGKRLCHIDTEPLLGIIVPAHKDVESKPIINSLSPDDTDKNVKVNVLGFTTGSIPDNSEIGKLHAYIARYHNSMAAVIIEKHPDLDNLMDEYVKQVVKITGTLTPSHSSKAETKYKEWLSEMKLGIFPEKNVHNIFVKNETYTTINRNRVITDADKATTIGLLKYVYPAHDAQSKLDDHYAPGKDKGDLDIHSVPNHVGLDCAGLDGSISIILRRLEYKLLHGLYPKHKKDISKLLDNETLGIFRICSIAGINLTVPTMGSRLSGSGITAYGNTQILRFLQFAYRVKVLKMSVDKAYRECWAYGDDATFPQEHTQGIIEFASTFGIKITIETGNVDGITFLSEFTTAEGKATDMQRMINKATAFYTKYSFEVGFINKLRGYYNPNKIICDDLCNKFTQTPVFSRFGKSAHNVMLTYIKYLKIVNTKTLNIGKVKRAFVLDEKYAQNSSKDQVTYDNQIKNITFIHKKYEILLDKYDSLNEYTFKTFSLKDAVNNLRLLFVQALNELSPFDDRYRLMNGKTNPQIEGLSITPTCMECKPLNKDIIKRFYDEIMRLDRYSKVDRLHICITLANKHHKFWKNIDLLVKRGILPVHLRAAAKKNFEITQKQLLDFKNLNKPKTKTKQNETNKNKNIQESKQTKNDKTKQKCSTTRRNTTNNQQKPTKKRRVYKKL